MIDEAGLLPDMRRYDPATPAEYPNGRALTDHVVEARLAMISNNSVPATGWGPTTTCSRSSPTSARRTRIHHRLHRRRRASDLSRKFAGTFPASVSG